MNFIIIMSDSLRRDHLSIYNTQTEKWASGGQWAVKTPNLDEFANRAALFHDFYVVPTYQSADPSGLRLDPPTFF